MNIDNTGHIRLRKRITKAPQEAGQKLIKACRSPDRVGVLDDPGHFSPGCGDGDPLSIDAAMAPGQVTERDLIVVNPEGGKRQPGREENGL